MVISSNFQKIMSIKFCRLGTAETRGSSRNQSFKQNTW